jgi:hypothetical protein
MFQLDIQAVVSPAIQTWGHKGRDLADNVAQAYKQITFSTHLYPSLLKNIDFVRIKLVTDPAGG